MFPTSGLIPSSNSYEDTNRRHKPKSSRHNSSSPQLTRLKVAFISLQDPEEYRVNVRPRLQLLVQAGWREWLIVHIIKAGLTENTQKSAKRVFAKIEDQFRRERYFHSSHQEHHRNIFSPRNASRQRTGDAGRDSDSDSESLIVESGKKKLLSLE